MERSGTLSGSSSRRMKATKQARALAKTHRNKNTVRPNPIRPKYRFTFGRGAQRGAPVAADAPVLAEPRSALPKRELPARRATNGSGPATLKEPIKTRSGVDLTEKIQELINLAHERGYLTAD